MLDVRNAADFQAAFGVSRETADRIGRYVETLLAWQKSINLVAPGTLPDIWQRHIADSAQVFALAPSDWLKWVDLGSGGGFPGVIVALMATDRADARVVLVESDARKCAFLREVVRKTGLGETLAVDILSGRIESPEIQAKVGHVDVVSARALAPLDGLLALAAPFFGLKPLDSCQKGEMLLRKSKPQGETGPSICSWWSVKPMFALVSLSLGTSDRLHYSVISYG